MVRSDPIKSLFLCEKIFAFYTYLEGVVLNFVLKAPLENTDGLHFKPEHHVPVHQQVNQK